MDDEKENERIRVAVKRMSTMISSSFDPKGHILNYLFGESILTIKEKAAIEKIGSVQDRAASLLEILFVSQNPRRFIAFKKSLHYEYS